MQYQQKCFLILDVYSQCFAEFCEGQWQDLPYADGLAGPQDVEYFRLLSQNKTSSSVLLTQYRSLGPIDSKITSEAMEYICYVLTVKESKKDNYRLNSLNFDFCYL